MKTIHKIPSCYNVSIHASREDAKQHYLDRRENAKRKRLENKIAAIESASDKLQEAFNQFVPDRGHADSLGGELVRAMMRIIYRDFNDGDLFYEGYGEETCGDAVAFIYDNTPDSVSGQFEFIAQDMLTDSSYTHAIERISVDLMNYLMENPEEYFATLDPSEQFDFQDYDGPKFIRDMGWEPSYEFSCDLPDSIIAHIDAGNISEQDLENELLYWDFADRNRDVSIHVDDDRVEIDGLDKESYDELNRHMFDWLSNYGDDLTDEYGYPEDEE